jgi:hypothetical protein
VSKDERTKADCKSKSELDKLRGIVLDQKMPLDLEELLNSCLVMSSIMESKDSDE